MLHTADLTTLRIDPLGQPGGCAAAVTRIPTQCAFLLGMQQDGPRHQDQLRGARDFPTSFSHSPPLVGGEMAASIFHLMKVARIDGPPARTFSRLTPR